MFIRAGSALEAHDDVPTHPPKVFENRYGALADRNVRMKHARERRLGASNQTHPYHGTYR